VNDRGFRPGDRVWIDPSQEEVWRETRRPIYVISYFGQREIGGRERPCARLAVAPGPSTWASRQNPPSWVPIEWLRHADDLVTRLGRLA